MTVPRAVTRPTAGLETEGPLFAGKVVIVTGCAGGIGRRAVDLFLEDAARVVAVDKPGVGLKAAFVAQRSAVECIEIDLRTSDAATSIVSQAVERFGRVDILVNNAGVTTRAPIENTSDDVWADMIDINLKAAFNCCRAVTPALRRVGGGSIVNVASINAIRGNVDLAAYSSAKAGLLGLTRALATELASDNIRVNAICPGTIDTPMTDEYLAEVEDRNETLAQLKTKHPLGRLGTADDVARTIAFVASDHAAFITGAVIPVDGGRHLV